MNCTIKWNSLSLEEWNTKFRQVRRASVLQSYHYAQATCPAAGQKARWGLIQIDGQEAGLVQIAEASLLFGACHAIILDMGPLWFDHNDLEQKSASFFEEFNHQFPKRWGRKRRIIPTIGSENAASFSAAGLNHQAGSSYDTIWLDLTQDEELLRKNLKQKWRNLLNKSERQDIEFKTDYTGATLAKFIPPYAHDYHTRNYKNIKPQEVAKFFSIFAKDKACFLAHAVQGEEIIASAFILQHGAAATYQIGLLTSKGRELCANYFLLWHIILELKNNEIKDFDLGGLNAYDAKGIQHFKEGLGGEKISYLGIYS